MNDSYWIKMEESSEKWEDVNPKINSLSEIVANIMLVGSSLTLSGHLHNPEFTNKGAYAKCWIREEVPYLYKASTKDGIESEIEISGSKILSHFNVEHTVYSLATYKGATNLRICKSKNIATDILDMVNAEDVSTYCYRHDMDFHGFVEKIDKENIYKMCICDYLISNSDRHLGNWGFYMNNDTGELVSCHPLYDHNNAFDKEFMKNGGESLYYQGKTQEEVAKYMIKKCDFKINSPIYKNEFIDEEMYESFMSNAAKLNLYKELNETPTVCFRKG